MSSSRDKTPSPLNIIASLDDIDKIFLPLFLNVPCLCFYIRPRCLRFQPLCRVDYFIEGRRKTQVLRFQLFSFLSFSFLLVSFFFPLFFPIRLPLFFCFLLLRRLWLYHCFVAPSRDTCVSVSATSFHFPSGVSSALRGTRSRSWTILYMLPSNSTSQMGSTRTLSSCVHVCYMYVCMYRVMKGEVRRQQVPPTRPRIICMRLICWENNIRANG